MLVALERGLGVIGFELLLGLVDPLVGQAVGVQFCQFYHLRMENEVGHLHVDVL